MGIAASLRRATAPVASALNAKLETLFRHVTNEAQHTRASLGARIDRLQSETHRVHDRMYEVVDPAMTTVAEASTLLQHAALRVERRLAELGAGLGQLDPGLAGLAGSRASVEVPFALAALGRTAPGGPVVLVGDLALLGLFTAGAGHPTTLVGRGAGPHDGIAVEGLAWSGSSAAPPPRKPPLTATAAEEAAPAALVVHASPSPLTTDDQDRLMTAAARLSPSGRLILAAPLGGRNDAALAALAEAGWAVTHRVTASEFDGAWTVSPPAEPTADHLVLVELARAPG